MLRTYELSRAPGGAPLYEQLYRAIRADILSGQLAGGEKLPSRRALAEHLNVSKITVEKAYQQLLCEGYLNNGNRTRYEVNRFSENSWPAPASPAAKSPQPIPTPQSVNFPARDR